MLRRQRQSSAKPVARLWVSPTLTDDGYVPGSAARSPYPEYPEYGEYVCTFHSSDYDDMNYIISLKELLRTVQHFNAGAVVWYWNAGCEITEDRFCDPADLGAEGEDGPVEFEGEGAAAFEGEGAPEPERTVFPPASSFPVLTNRPVRKYRG